MSVMRIAVINHSSRKIGGTETYIEAVLPLLSDRGHAVSMWTEMDEPAQTPPIRLPLSIKHWSASQSGTSPALAALTAWRPDVIYCHRLLNPTHEAAILGIAPMLFFAHDYYGTCISGAKSFMFPPRGRPCHRRFGPGCLLCYYPRRCGGLSPLTMWRDYTVQKARLKSLSKYAAVVVASEHMAMEYRQHGLSAQVLHYIQEPPMSIEISERQPPKEELNLFFMGRMEKLKGGHMLLAALPQIAKFFPGKVRCDFAGDGRQTTRWQTQAAALMAAHRQIKVNFHGWLGSEPRRRLLLKSHLLVVPSIWPEPFGLVGCEAGALGVPTVAFDVGGISEWLKDGENGVLAPGNPPKPEGLGQAVAKAIAQPQTYQHLCAGSVRQALRYQAEDHIRRLEYILEQIT